MPSLACLLLDHAPYGSLLPAEAIRHAGGAFGKGWDVVLAFMGGGIYATLPGQSPREGEWTSLSQSLGELIETSEGRVRVLVEQEALEACGLSAGDLIPGVKPAPLGEIAQAVAECDRTLIF
jgi:sulfur relay (sulfurtransferase) complex TusBCD TusD component (DsrE family)